MLQRTYLNLAILSLMIGLFCGLSGCGSRSVSAPINDRTPPPELDSVDKKNVREKERSRAENSVSKTHRSTHQRFYIVKRGDTLYSIAVQFGLDHKVIANLNGISDLDVINVGQRLKLVPDSHTPEPPKSSSKSDTESPKQSIDPSPKTSGDTPKLGTWRWPVDGTLDYRYGERVNENGKGIGLRVSQEQAVFASAPGKVVYSGNGLRGYGNLLIIKHGEDYLSVYAFTSRLLASEGQYIAQGQQVAIIGSTADSRVLHFEIRVKGKPINPLNYLLKK